MKRIILALAFSLLFIETFGQSRICDTMPLSLSYSSATWCSVKRINATPGFSNYQWSRAEVSISGPEPYVDVTTGGTWKCIAGNPDSCPSTSYVSIPWPIEFESCKFLCLVTYDETTGKNRLVFTGKTEGIPIDSIGIWRDEYYVDIVHLGIDETEFIDTEASTGIEHYYFVYNIDSCGRPIWAGEQMTVHLRATFDVNNNIVLEWNNNGGITGDRLIYRAIGENGQFEKIGQVPDYNSSYYTDVNPPAGLKRYQLRQDNLKQCFTDVAQMHSNIIAVNPVGLEELNETGISVYPIPSKDIIKVEAANALKSAYLIFNVTGQPVQAGMLDGKITEINIKSLPQGIYWMQTTTGKVKIVKG